MTSFGRGARPNYVLGSLGAAISSPTEERLGVAWARDINPAVRIVVRTCCICAIDELMWVQSG